MKNIINKITVMLLVITTALLPFAATAQNKSDKKKEEIKKLVESKHYVFKAQTMLPSSGATRQLTSDFDLTVAGDSIISYLPYFGRAYSAPVNPTEGPLQFTSTNFQYKVTNKKKGGWDIMISPQDVQDPKQMALSIFDNGSASLTVTSVNRQPVAFNGYIVADKH